MNLETEKQENVYTIRLKGSLDGSNSGDFHQYMEECARGGYRLFLFHLDRLEYITSSGISVFLRLQKLANQKHIFVALCGANSEVLTVLDFLGITKKWKHFSGREEAENFLRALPILPRAGTSPSQTIPESRFTPVATTSYSAPVVKSSPKPVKFYFQEDRPEKSFVSQNQQDSTVGSTLASHDLPTSSLERIEEEPKVQEAIAKETSSDSVAPHINHSVSKMQESIEPILPKEPETQWDQVLDEKIQSIRKEMERDREELKSVLLSIAKKDEKAPDRVAYYVTKPDPKKYARGVMVTPEFEDTVYCESCNQKLKLYKPGFHKCPQCSTEFEYTRDKKIRYLEKL